MLGIEQVREEILALSEELRRHQYRYYVESRPTVSDSEYDRMMDRLIELESRYPELLASDSPSQRVGSDLASSFPEVKHSVPVLSLDKAYTAEHVLQWIERTRNRGEQRLSFVVEEKMDGVSLVLYYEQGLLAKAVTRGNGFVGNDVTANAKTIASIPLRLSEPLDIAVRGEVFLMKDDFLKLNQSMEIPYANPRNLAAGTLRRLKSRETARVPLRMFAYEAYGPGTDGMIQTHVASLSRLHDLGFLVNPTVGCFAEDPSRVEEQVAATSIQPEVIGDYGEITSFVALMDERRANLPYEIDGLVIKVNELAVREFLGYTGHHPRWALAYKFDAPEAQTVVRSIDVQVGRTGRITPVARVEKVKVGNSMVSNVTLHNQDYIQLLELAIGDLVAISKRGDVIPAVERVIEKNEQGNTTWSMPKSCPSCQQPLHRQGAHLFCTNTGCPDQVLGRISFFVGRNQMDIDGFGPETVAFLVQKNLVQDVPDIYQVDYSKLVGEPGFGEKKVASLEKSVEASKDRPFRTVLVSLGIPDFGKKAVDLLVNSGVVSMRELFSLVDAGNRQRLLEIKGFGQKTVDALFAHLSDPHMRRRIERLEALGLKCSEEPALEDASIPQVFAGQTWCVTGSFEHFSPRSLALKEIEARGGRTTGSVTGKTTHLLAGTGAGSKLQQAISLGMTIVDERQFLTMLEHEE